MTESNSSSKAPVQKPVQQNQPDQKKSRQSVRTVLIYAIALATSCVAITQLLFPAHFETVDDLNFSLLLSGVGLTHTPTFMTWFTNVLITFPLMLLYQCVPDIPWYSVYLFSVLIASFTIFAAAFMLRFNLKVGAGLFLIYFVSIGALVENGLQYTSTAALLTQAGFLLACCLPMTKRFPARRFPTWIILVSFIATVFASMIRFEPFMLVLLTCSITALAVAPGKVDLIKRNAKPLCWFAIAVIIGFSLKTANNFYYDSQHAYAGVRELFKPFSDIADSDREYLTDKPHKLSENDFGLVKQFFVADRDVFTTEALSLSVAGSEIPFTAHKLQWVFETNIFPLLLLCLASACFLDFKIMSKKRLAIWVSGVVMLILYLAFFMKLPTRVHLALLSCAMTTLFMFMDREKLKKFIQHFQHKPKRIRSYAVAIFIAGCLAYSTISALYEDCAYYNEKGALIAAAIKRLTPQPGQLFIVLGTTTPYQFMRPFQNLRSTFARFDIYRTGLWSRLPIGYTMMEDHGASSMLDACKSQNVFFISNNTANELFAKFCSEHYQSNAVFTHVLGEPQADFDVYTIKLTPKKKS